LRRNSYTYTLFHRDGGDEGGAFVFRTQMRLRIKALEETLADASQRLSPPKPAT
jgi:hypothetical protein